MIDGNRVLFRFDHQIDMKRVIDNSPWAFDRNLLVIKPVAVEENPMKVDLDWCDFHTHIHDLPLGKMTKEIAKFIGNQIGRFIDVESDNNNGIWGSSLRIRVSLNITKTLKRVLRIRTSMGEDQLISFTYEQLPNFCYLCGCLGHFAKYCELQLQTDFVDLGENMPYGPWLRANQLPSIRNRLQASNRTNSSNGRHMPSFSIDPTMNPRPENRNTVKVLQSLETSLIKPRKIIPPRHPHPTTHLTKALTLLRNTPAKPTMKTHTPTSHITNRHHLIPH
ncbi:hypothetical protein Salat_0999200 [Sesamum alatum]|uniref:CCHC-type domain-containing protein n=1 Tax=Sesamum alatum TaxID=300844 RepID=A0AAE1YLD4_9LAMI|nr:hypothetical protein Salat_0999200 [Sesamum alatum]